MHFPECILRYFRMPFLIHRRVLSKTKIILLFVSILAIVANILMYRLVWRNSFTYHGTAHIDSIIQKTLEEAIREDWATGCETPKLDPFDKVVTQYDNVTSLIDCYIPDWVKCNFSECTIVGEGATRCTMRDMLYRTDRKYDFGPPTVIRDNEVYTLKESDHVTIECSRLNKDNFVLNWDGVAIGYRPVKPLKPARGRENTPNVVIIGFDSVSRNMFIRKLPKSYKFITEELGAVVLNKYNIVGDGTSAALFALLSGIAEFEHPECRKGMKRGVHVDDKIFLFHKLMKDGYRTAYFEDSPWIGTFQFRLNGFIHQPADHYLRHPFLEDIKMRQMSSYTEHCFAGTPLYKLLIDLTNQFLQFDGKLFAFTFIGHLSHGLFNYLPNADVPLVEFLNGMKQNGRLNNTLLIVMSDHGSRYSDLRKTYQGRLEERLPFMAIRLPDELKRRRPKAEMNLKHNVDALTTPFDIHTTVLDVVDMREHWNSYRIKSSKLPRGMTLLEEIPRNRLCSEAGILPHWCTCLKWEPVEPFDPIYNRSAQALVDHINNITEFQREKCAIRNLTSIDIIAKKTPSKQFMRFKEAQLDYEVYLGRFGNPLLVYEQLYQVKITASPGGGAFEATVTYHTKEDKFYVNSDEISRTNAYNDEPACVKAIYPHLNKYCYCK